MAKERPVHLKHHGGRACALFAGPDDALMTNDPEKVTCRGCFRTTFYRAEIAAREAWKSSR